MVGELILVAYHVVVLDAVKFSFNFPNFGAICVHLLIGAGPVFVKLVDDQRGVSIYHEAFDAKLNNYTESMETCFIFGGVVGGWKMYLENISELILGQHNEQNVSTSAIDVESIIEVHHLVLGASRDDGLLDLGPLSDKISKHL